MPTDTLTLAEFLLARIAEDEAAVRRADEYAPHDVYRVMFRGPDLTRVLAECEAKRRIVEAAVRAAAVVDGDTLADRPLAYVTCRRDTLRGVCKALALPYADHPDYRDEWRA